MRHLREVIATVAPTPARVLIEGENGSGKELVARSTRPASTCSRWKSRRLSGRSPPGTP